MVSDTSKTEARRRLKQAAAGKARKKAQQKHGTTPKFPVHPEKAKGEKRSRAPKA
ncbi:MAG: hypothetical protein ACODAU_03515 [Myxococcota bacterium]